MRNKSVVVILLAFFIIHTTYAQKQICITVDDLPTVSSLYRNNAGQELLTKRLLNALTRHKVPAIGFVVGEKLYKQQQLDQHQLKLLTQWLQTGMELGNHTFAHKGFNAISAAEYQHDVRGLDSLLRPFLKTHHQPLRYFRHPYLQRGNTLSKRDSLVAYLSNHQYQEAPVSVDNSDYVFTVAYEKALRSKDSLLAARIGTDYVDYMLACVHYYEAQADSLFKRPIAQILLTHANTINAFYLETLLRRLADEGYQFISLTKALTDAAYLSQDTYVNTGGISWLHRWAITQGKRGSFFKGEPEVPGYVVSLADSR